MDTFDDLGEEIELLLNSPPDGQEPGTPAFSELESMCPTPIQLDSTEPLQESSDHSNLVVLDGADDEQSRVLSPTNSTNTADTTTTATNGFRLSARRVLLTWSQCLSGDWRERDGEQRTVTDLLNDLFTQCALRLTTSTDTGTSGPSSSEQSNALDVEHVVISVEKHQEHGEHVHCYLKFDKKVNIRNATNRFKVTFDRDPSTPNFKIVKGTPKKVIEYVKKDGDYLEFGGTEHVDYNELALAGKIKEAINAFRAKHPLQFATRYTTIVANFKAMAKPLKQKPLPVQVSGYLQTTLARVKPWVDGGWRTKTLLLTGSAGAGKTVLALYLAAIVSKEMELGASRAALEDHGGILVSNLQQLRDVEFSTNPRTSLVFDDINWECLSREKVIHLLTADMPACIRVLYGSVTIPAETPRIVTTNLTQEEFLRMDRVGQRQCHAFERRVYWCPVPKQPMATGVDWIQVPAEPRDARVEGTELVGLGNGLWV